MRVLGNNSIKLLYILQRPSHDERIKYTFSIIAKNSDSCSRVGHRPDFRKCLPIKTLSYCANWKDITKPSCLTEAINLFNNAGGRTGGTVDTITQTDFDEAMNLLLGSVLFGIRYAAPIMAAQGGGSIINMASVAGSVIAAPNRFVYGATKAGVIGLTKSIAADFVTKGIRANAICPGTVESPSLDQRLRDTGDYEAAKAAFIARQPIGRIAKAEEIANLVVYLASDESSYTTGVAHVIDGGWANI